MKRIKIGAGALLMLGSMMISDRAEILILYFLSAFLHECGHLFAAVLLGVGVREIRFEFSGIRICTDEKLMSYKSEILLAAAGPLANFICVGACVASFLLCGIPYGEVTALTDAFISGREYSRVGAVGFFAISALLQGGLNLLPVRSFDGGRILYCTVTLLLGQRAA